MSNAASTEQLVSEYTPLVRSLARRYYGRGAEFDDLVQEGYIALLVLIPKCPDMTWLAAFLKNNMPGYVRNAAARLRTRSDAACEVLLEDIEETVGEDESQKRYSEAELREMLRAALTADELDMTQALMEGFTQKEIADTLGLTQQAVGARLKKIRAKLKGILEGL